jgi:hypothetical protein
MIFITNLVERDSHWRKFLLAAGVGLALVAIACATDDPEPTDAPPAATSAPAPTAATESDTGAKDDVEPGIASVVVPLQEFNESDQGGVAVFLDKGDTTEIIIEMGSGEEDVPQPIHIHEGKCGSLGDIAFALNDVVNGSL